MRIATWNVNSVRQRLPHLLDYLGKAAPDALCLQELKCVDDAFPRAEVEAAGYRCAVHGQKGFNGVAILTRAEPVDVRIGLPGDDEDGQSRYIEAVLPGEWGPVRVASIYLPNGNPPDTDKYPYKLGFMDRLIRRAAELIAAEESVVLAGDYNVIPEPFLGLPGRRLAAGPRHPHRPPAAGAPCRRPAAIGHDRQAPARRRQAVRPRPGADRPRVRPSGPERLAGAGPGAPRSLRPPCRGGRRRRPR